MQRNQDFADIGFEKQLQLVRHYGPLHEVSPNQSVSTSNTGLN